MHLFGCGGCRFRHHVGYFRKVNPLLKDAIPFGIVGRGHKMNFLGNQVHTGNRGVLLESRHGRIGLINGACDYRKRCSRVRQGQNIDNATNNAVGRFLCQGLDQITLFSLEGTKE